MITGWKSITGMVLIAIGTVMTTIPPLFEGQESIGKTLIGLGAALGGIGIAHKIEKAAPTK